MVAARKNKVVKRTMTKFPDEQPVKVKVKITPTGEPAAPGTQSFENAQTVKQWVIMDTSPEMSRLACYRTDHPLAAVDAWAASVYEAEWFMTKALARTALKAMWRERLILAERTAHEAETIFPCNPAKA